MDPILILLLVAPFLGAVVCGLLPRSQKAAAIGFAAATAGLAIGAVLQSYGSALEQRVGTLPWLPGTLGTLPMFGFLVDPLSSLVLLLVAVLGLAVVMFSTEYVSGNNAEQPYQGGDNRYYFWLLTCLGSMIGLVLSPNLLQMFIFWEMTTVCSWAMISHARAGM